jgi:hypothetical protein
MNHVATLESSCDAQEKVNKKKDPPAKVGPFLRFSYRRLLFLAVALRAVVFFVDFFTAFLGAAFFTVFFTAFFAAGFAAVFLAGAGAALRTVLTFGAGAAPSAMSLNPFNAVIFATVFAGTFT